MALTLDIDPIATAACDAVAWLEASTGLTLRDEERAAVAYGVSVGYHVALSTAPTALPVCTSCGKSTRSHTRPRYCRACSDALDTFAQKFAPLPPKEI